MTRPTDDSAQAAFWSGARLGPRLPKEVIVPAPDHRDLSVRVSIETLEYSPGDPNLQDAVRDELESLCLNNSPRERDPIINTG